MPPAARVGDQTQHGGVITGPGATTVLIGFRPAAREGDYHTCPMSDPGPKPHVGGPIVGHSATVEIEMAMAARRFDKAACNSIGVSGAGVPPVMGNKGGDPDWEGELFDRDGDGWRDSARWKFRDDDGEYQKIFSLFGLELGVTPDAEFAYTDGEGGASFGYTDFLTSGWLRFGNKANGRAGAWEGSAPFTISKEGSQGKNPFVTWEPYVHAGEVSGESDVLLFHDGRRTGFALKGDVGLDTVAAGTRGEIHIPLPLGGSIDYVGGGQIGLGPALGFGPFGYLDHEEKRGHLGLLVDFPLGPVSLKGWGDLSAGRDQNSSQRRGTQGGGAGVATDFVITGEDTVLIG